MIFRKKILVSKGYLVYLQQVESGKKSLFSLWMWKCVLSLRTENSYCEKWMDVLWIIVTDIRGDIIQSGQNVLSPIKLLPNQMLECALLFDCFVYILSHILCCLLGNGFFSAENKLKEVLLLYQKTLSFKLNWLLEMNRN